MIPLLLGRRRHLDTGLIVCEYFVSQLYPAKQSQIRIDLRLARPEAIPGNARVTPDHVRIQPRQASRDKHVLQELGQLTGVLLVNACAMLDFVVGQRHALSGAQLEQVEQVAGALVWLHGRFSGTARSSRTGDPGPGYATASLRATQRERCPYARLNSLSTMQAILPSVWN